MKAKTDCDSKPEEKTDSARLCAVSLRLVFALSLRCQRMSRPQMMNDRENTKTIKMITRARKARGLDVQMGSHAICNGTKALSRSVTLNFSPGNCSSIGPALTLVAAFSKAAVSLATTQHCPLLLGYDSSHLSVGGRLTGATLFDSTHGLF